MSEPLYLATILIIAGAFVVVFALRAYATRQDARAKTSKEEAYRDISARSAAAHTETNERLGAVQTELSSVSTRLAAIEKLLRDVG